MFVASYQAEQLDPVCTMAVGEVGRPTNTSDKLLINLLQSNMHLNYSNKYNKPTQYTTKEEYKQVVYGNLPYIITLGIATHLFFFFFLKNKNCFKQDY